MTDKKKSTFKKYWWLWLIFSVIIVVGLVFLILLVIVKPPSVMKAFGLDNSGPTGPDGKVISDFDVKEIEKALKGAPNFGWIPQNLGDFDDSTQANSHSPKLSEPFPYGSIPIRGVNLGGWLVLEPFLAPDLFASFDPKDKVVDEWTLCTKLGKTKCIEVLHKHYDTFVTEFTIKKIRDAGLNHVRIPIPFWSVSVQENEPYVYGSWYYLLRAIQWCRKYGIRVQIDFHTAPGSQNGWNHSGRVGATEFLNTTNPNNDQLVNRFNDGMMKTIQYFSQPQFKNVVTMYTVLNEPRTYSDEGLKMVEDFYKKSYKMIREKAHTNNTSPVLVYSEAFKGFKHWPKVMPKTDYKNVAINGNNYIAFAPEVYEFEQDKILGIPCGGWQAEYKASTQEFGFTVCGEFSVASNDCGPYVNGVFMGNRMNGDYDKGKDSVGCTDCKCHKHLDWKNYTPEYKQFLRKFVEYQMDAFELGGLGWFFWNFQTQNHKNPLWDYFLGLDEGWIPKDANNREFKCGPLN